MPSVGIEKSKKLFEDEGIIQHFVRKKDMKLRTFSSLVLMMATTGFIYQSKAFGHGVAIEYQATEAISIQAKYDNGKPMSNAQVAVYSPENPSEAWQTGVTDDEGKFAFVPENDISGNWTVKVRSAGHGNVINIPLQSQNTETENSTQQEISASTNNMEEKTSSVTPSATGELSPSQKILMAITGSWGFIGTALFFSRQSTK